MEPLQLLYYGLGQVCYAIARSDGDIQREEVKRLHQIMVSEFEKFPQDFGSGEIIFELLRRQNSSGKVAFDLGLRNIISNKAFLSESLKEHFVEVAKRVAESFPPVTADEEEFLMKFVAELNVL